MQTNRKGYHDIEVDFEGIMLDGGMVDELFRLQDLRNRKLFLNEGIDQCSVADIVKHIMQYNSDDKGIFALVLRKAHLPIGSCDFAVDKSCRMRTCSRTGHHIL